MEQIARRKTLNEEVKPLKIYIGWDSREDIAYQVAKLSIEKHASVPVEIVPLKQHSLRKEGLYWREIDKLASTEFTFTRFLIPELNKFQGWALFIDCDFVFLDDVKKLFDQADNKYAIMCAQHEYTPKKGVKMDGQQQTSYPRKNWSSMMLINCAHTDNQCMTKEFVNDIKKTGAYLHRFSWLNDSKIGKLSHEWNWLVGWYKEPDDGSPRALHYTEGGPWFDHYYNCEYAAEYYRVERNYLNNIIKNQYDSINDLKKEPKTVDNLTLAEHLKEPIKALTYASIDPAGKYYGYTEEHAMQIIQNKFAQGKLSKAAAIDSEGGINYTSKGLKYDEYLQAFMLGCNGTLSDWDSEKNKTNPLIIRGLGGGSRKAIQHCWETGRTFYAIDTGYFGNAGSKSKIWHRITKDALQNTGPIIERPGDRLIKYKYRKFKDGNKILLVPPSDKVMQLFGQLDPEIWVENTKTELQKYTDRPIEIRLKPNRSERISTMPLESALADNVHCLITYNSIAALEALMFGVPAIALGPNCATVLCNTKLHEIENVNKPTEDEMYALVKHLSYCQFTREEMMNGYAWNIVNEGG
jgi:lipopolysaccharide biosynthesis glycosyltransferase